MRQQPLCDPPMSHLTHLRDSSLRSVLLVKKQAQRTWIGPTQACIAPELGFSPPRCWLWLSLGYFGWVNEPRPSGHFHNPASQTGRLEEKKQTVWESLRKILIHVHELSSVDIRREKWKSLSRVQLWLHRLHSPWNSPGQNTGVGSLPFSRGSSRPRDRTQVSCIEGGFFTSWATGEAQTSLGITQR